MCKYGLDLPKVLARQLCRLWVCMSNSLERVFRPELDLTVVAAQVAEHLESAVTAALEGGFRTADLYSAGTQKVGCSEMGNVLQDMLRGGQPAAH